MNVPHRSELVVALEAKGVDASRLLGTAARGRRDRFRTHVFYGGYGYEAEVDAAPRGYCCRIGAIETAEATRGAAVAAALWALLDALHAQGL